MNKFDKELIISTHSTIFSVEYLSIKSDTLEMDYILTGHRDGSIVVWELDTFTMARTFKEHKSFVDDIKSLIYGKFVSCSKDNTIKIWNISKDHSVLTIINDSWNFCLAHLKNFDDKFFAVGDDNKRIQIFEIEKGYKIQNIETGHSKGVARLLHISQRPPYNYLLSSSKPDIKLWDLKEGKLLRSFREHKAWVITLTYLTNDLFCSGSDESIKIWNFNTDVSVRTIYVHKSTVSSLIYWKNLEENVYKEILITGSMGKTMKFVDLGIVDIEHLMTYDFKILKTKEIDESIFKMIFLRNKEMLASIYWGSKKLKIWGSPKNENNIPLDLEV